MKYNPGPAKMTADTTAVAVAVLLKSETNSAATAFLAASMLATNITTTTATHTNPVKM
jgi:hypothetical protein